MKTLLRTMVLMTSAGAAGCIVFSDHPEPELVSGRVVWAGTDQPVPEANVTIWEARPFFTIFPVSYPAAARTQSDAEGYFSVPVVNQWPARITASTRCGSGESTIVPEALREVVVEIGTEARQSCSR